MESWVVGGVAKVCSGCDDDQTMRLRAHLVLANVELLGRRRALEVLGYIASTALEI